MTERRVRWLIARSPHGLEQWSHTHLVRGWWTLCGRHVPENKESLPAQPVVTCLRCLGAMERRVA